MAIRDKVGGITDRVRDVSASVGEGISSRVGNVKDVIMGEQGADVVLPAPPPVVADEFVDGEGSQALLNQTPTEADVQRATIMDELHSHLGKLGGETDQPPGVFEAMANANLGGSIDELPIDRLKDAALLVVAAKGGIAQLENHSELFQKAGETIGLRVPVLPTENTATAIQAAAQKILKKGFGSAKAIPATDTSVAQRPGYSLEKLNLGAQLATLAYKSPKQIRSQLHLLGLNMDSLQIIDDKKSGSFAFVVADHDGNVFTSIRGTEGEFNDILTDANVVKYAPRWAMGTGIRVHTGFERGLDAIWDDLEKAIKDCRGEEGKVHFSGHSLGGALAQMAALRSVVAGITTGDKMSVVTAGAPRGGNARYVTLMDQHIHDNIRVVQQDVTGRKSDVVTAVPPKILGYRHAGTAVFLRPDGYVKKVETKPPTETREYRRSLIEAVAPQATSFVRERAESLVDIRAGGYSDVRDPGIELFEESEDLDAIRDAMTDSIMDEEVPSNYPSTAPARTTRIRLHKMAGYVGNVADAMIHKALKK